MPKNRELPRRSERLSLVKTSGSTNDSPNKPEDGLRPGIASRLTAELLANIIKEATYVSPPDDDDFWLHGCEPETMLAVDHVECIRQYASVNRWWRSVVRSCCPLDIECQSTLHVDRDTANLEERQIGSIRTFMWDQGTQEALMLPPAAYQTATLERFLRKVDGHMFKALALRHVTLQPTFDATIYRGWEKLTYFCYGRVELPDCFIAVTTLLRQLQNLQSLTLVDIHAEGVTRSTLVKWAAGDSRRTLEELVLRPQRCYGYKLKFKKDFSDLLPGNNQLSLRRVSMYGDHLYLFDQCDLGVLVWLKLTFEAPQFDFTEDMLARLAKCKAVDRLWISIDYPMALRDAISHLRTGWLPALVFLGVVFFQADDCEDPLDEGALDDLHAVCDAREYPPHDKWCLRYWELVALE